MPFIRDYSLSLEKAGRGLEDEWMSVMLIDNVKSVCACC